MLRPQKRLSMPSVTACIYRLIGCSCVYKRGSDVLAFTRLWDCPQGAHERKRLKPGRSRTCMPAEMPHAAPNGFGA
jgi:hypothetical protein